MKYVYENFPSHGMKFGYRMIPTSTHATWACLTATTLFLCVYCYITHKSNRSQRGKAIFEVDRSRLYMPVYNENTNDIKPRSKFDCYIARNDKLLMFEIGMALHARTCGVFALPLHPSFPPTIDYCASRTRKGGHFIQAAFMLADVYGQP